MNYTDVFVRIFTFCFGFGATIWAGIVGFKDYNKRKIEEAKQKSVGAEAIKEIKEEVEKMKKDHYEFRKDMLEIIFQSRPRT